MASEMSSSALVELLLWFEGAGIEVWLEGGWGVDALLGAQTRVHKDVDIILRVSDVPALRELLSSSGFSEQPGGTPSNFVLAHSSGLEVDVHAVTFAPNGDGICRTANGADWAFPAEGFGGGGVVKGRPFRCLSPDIQVLCHAHGYVPVEKDLHDMELLQQRFGVELPPQLSGARHESFASQSARRLTSLCRLTVKGRGRINRGSVWRRLSALRAATAAALAGS